MNRSCFLLVFIPMIFVMRVDNCMLAAQEKASTEAPAAQKADDPSNNDPSNDDPSNDDPSNNDREQRLAAYLSGAKFVGNFTIDGKDVGSKAEEYTISKCEKLPTPDLYRMTARIKYGETDSEVPLDIKILWSGRTPVITLDSFWIPGMGTFGARVLIHADRYAGTWQHDAVGGHMFGKIVKAKDAE